MKVMNLKRLIAMLLALVICVMVAAPMGAEAATTYAKKKKTINASTNDNDDKIPSVKTGTTTINVKENSYYKFKAKKTGTYVITISDVAGVGNRNESINGYVALGYMESSTLVFFTKKYKTEGGKNSSFNVCSENFYNVFNKSSTSKMKDKYLKKRTITVKLKKGETIYFNNNFISDTSKVQYTLKIKKK